MKTNKQTSDLYIDDAAISDEKLTKVMHSGNHDASLDDHASLFEELELECVNEQELCESATLIKGQGDMNNLNTMNHIDTNTI